MIKVNLMKIFVAQEAGFCFGVKRALTLINQQIKKKQDVQILGELIHNKSVLDELKKIDIFCISNLKDIDPRKKTIIRTHGIPVDDEKTLIQNGIDYIDATCPLVKKTHRIIQKLNDQNTRIVIIGDRNHSEIKATRSYCTSSQVINSLTEAKNLKPAKSISVIAQTTLDSVFFREIINILKEKAENLEIYDTICHATKVRQEAIKKLASQVDLVIVIGGKHSSNTKKLFDIAIKINRNTYHIESLEELNRSDFIQSLDQFKTVGITAGASTPPQEIENVKTFFKALKENKNGRTKRKPQHKK